MTTKTLPVLSFAKLEAGMPMPHLLDIQTRAFQALLQPDGRGAERTDNGLERVFKLRENGTTVRTELRAGLVTFLTMSYIIFVQPAVLSQAGMDFGAVMAATCIASAVATLVKLLQDPDSGVRANAANACHRVPDDQELEPLVALLKDENLAA